MNELPVRGIRVIKDTRFDTSQTLYQQSIPFMNSSFFPPNLVSQVGSGIAYDTVSKRVYYNNGATWIPLAAAGSGTGASFSYAFIKNSAKTIPPSTPTIVDDWTMVPSPPYHDNTSDWNLITGIYTANAPQTLTLMIDIAWAAGVSNQGSRTLQVIYKPALGIPMVAKQDTTQGEPDTSIETPQEETMALQMNTGDQAWIQVLHTAPTDLILASGNQSSISGIRINPS